MAKRGRPATGQGTNKYIPIRLLGFVPVLIFLMRKDKEALKEIEGMAERRAIEKGFSI